MERSRSRPREPGRYTMSEMAQLRATLSDRARQCLERGRRNATPGSREDVELELASAGLPKFEIVVDTLFHFGGYNHPVGLNETFHIHAVRDAVASFRWAGTKSDDPETFRIPFGEHPTAQMWFLMDGCGRIFTDDTLIADNVLQWIEDSAIHDMVERRKNCVRIVFPESASLIRTWADQNMRRFAPASSRASAWWLRPQFAVKIFVPWSSEADAAKWSWLFATSDEEAHRQARQIGDSIGITPSDTRPWPP